MVVAVVLVLVGAIGFFLRGRFIPAQAGLLVESTPQAQVFVDGQEAGITPLDMTRRPGEAVVKLVPIADNGPLAPYEIKVTLVPGIKTVIRRDIGPTDDESAGEVISFEAVGGRITSMSVVSSPDAAEVLVDGVSQGFAPVRVDLVAGDHTVTVRAQGFLERTVKVMAVSGFKLTLVVKLAQSGEATEEAEEESPVFVEILETPTGFLRVRAEPSTTATESARVTPGKRYLLLGENEAKTWYQIEYEEGKTGWISAQYAEKVEE